MTTTPEQYGKVLATVLAAELHHRPSLRACRRWEDLDPFMDANVLYMDVDRLLGIEMPDTVEECEAWYYPMLTAATAG